MSLAPRFFEEAAGRTRSPFAAVVLAGSYGWGTTPIPTLPPRPLASVGLRPLITYAMEWLASGGASEIVVCANGSARTLRDRLGDAQDGAPLAFRDDQLPRGPAGCLRDAAGMFDSDTLVVVEGTVIPTLGLPRLLDAHQRSGAAMTVVTTPGRGANRYTPAGIYVLQRRALDFVKPTGFQDIKEILIPRLHDAGEVVLPHHSRDECPRVANLATYLSVNQWLVERVAAARRLDGAFGRDTNDATSQLDDGAVIVGPVMMGRGVRVARGATIVGPAVIGDHANVGTDALVSHSVVGSRVTIEAGASAHACVLADDVSVPARASLHRRVELPDSARPGWLSSLLSGISRRRRAGDAGHLAPALPVEDARPEAL